MSHPDETHSRPATSVDDDRAAAAPTSQKPALTIRLDRPRNVGDLTNRANTPMVAVRTSGQPLASRDSVGTWDRPPVRPVARAANRLSEHRSPPSESRRRWNTLAIMSLPLAILLPPVGWITGRLAAKQIRRSGERGALLATFGHIVGFALFVVLATDIAIESIAYAVYGGLAVGIKGGIVSAVLAVIELVFP